MTQDRLPADALVGAYRKIRAAMEEKQAAFDAEFSALKEQLEAVSDQILSICNEQNLDSLKTKNGTVTRRTATRYWTSDWQSMYDFIREHDAPYLLEQRIHNGNMKQFMDENPGTLPVGLNADTKYKITVRKPTNK